MADFLAESGRRANRPPLMNTFMRGSSAKYEEDMKTMNTLVLQRQSSCAHALKRMR